MQDLIITFLASFLILFLFLGLFALWVIDGKIKREQVLHALLAVLLTWVIAFIIKDLFPSDRPFINNIQKLPMTFITPQDASFPSSHTAVAFALGTTMFLHDRKIGLSFFFGSALVAVGRILANVHYPSDIIAGALLGITVAWVSAHIHLFGLLSDEK